MNNNPRVSVIIPAYNHENYVQDTIKSIIEQTYQNIELLVIDDGSKDSTWQKIQEMKEVCENRFVRVHFETKENEGSCKTLNKLLSLAQGEFVYIIASDDLAKSNAIEKEVEFLVNNEDYALVVGDDEIIDSEGKRVYWDRHRNIVYSKKEAKFLTFGAALKHMRKDINFNSDKFGTYATFAVGNYVPNGYLIRGSIFEKIGYFTPEAPLEDLWLLMQIAKYAKMKYLDEILFSYRWHSTNTVKNHTKMIEMTRTTQLFEKNNIEKVDINDCQNSFKQFLKEGYRVKRKGIPFIFEICKYEDFDVKRKVLKILSIPVSIKVINK